MGKLMFDALDLSPNGKQVIASGIDAVQLSIFRMMTTPRGSLPDFPNIGFEMEHFFGINKDNPSFDDLCSEFREQVRTLVNNETVEVVIRRVKGGVIRFEMAYVDNNKLKSIGASLSRDSSNNIIFKNITLK